MRAAKWASCALALLAGCVQVDENPDWTPKDLPAWTYDSPSYYRPTEDLPVREKIGPGIPIYYSRHRDFFVVHPGGYQVSGVPRMAVWSSTDEGRNWEKCGYFGAEQTHFLFEAEADGAYWVRFIGPGQTAPDVPPGMPHRIYVVDTQPPAIEVSVRPGPREDEQDKDSDVYRPGETVVVRWTVRDANLDEEPVSLGIAFAEFPNNVVLMEIPEALEPSGSLAVEVPAEAAVRGGVRFRVKATDKADNVGLAVTEVLHVQAEAEPVASAAETAPVVPPSEPVEAAETTLEVEAEPSGQAPALTPEQPEAVTEPPSGEPAVVPAEPVEPAEPAEPVDPVEPGAGETAPQPETAAPSNDPTEAAEPIDPIEKELAVEAEPSDWGPASTPEQPAIAESQQSEESAEPAEPIDAVEKELMVEAEPSEFDPASAPELLAAAAESAESESDESAELFDWFEPLQTEPAAEAELSDLDLASVPEEPLAADYEPVESAEATAATEVEVEAEPVQPVGTEAPSEPARYEAQPVQPSPQPTTQPAVRKLQPVLYVKPMVAVVQKVEPFELIHQTQGTPGQQLGWPRASAMIRGGTYRLLGWLPELAADYEKVKLEFSANDGRLWRTVAEDLEFGKPVWWTVPMITSKICRLRIVGIDKQGWITMLALSPRFTVDTVVQETVLGPKPVQLDP